MEKYIVTHEACGSRFGNAFIVTDCYDKSFSYYKELLEEARKSFPDLAEEEMECLRVTKSRSRLGCTMIRFCVGPDAKREGWENTDRLTDIGY